MVELKLGVYNEGDEDTRTHNSVSIEESSYAVTEDVDLEELADMFKRIMSAYGFTQEQVEEVFKI
jgi:predicted house-cleaning noncanonical NTP pyrophosphatase (MazG superfamily)